MNFMIVTFTTEQADRSAAKHAILRCNLSSFYIKESLVNFLNIMFLLQHSVVEWLVPGGRVDSAPAS